MALESGFETQDPNNWTWTCGRWREPSFVGMSSQTRRGNLNPRLKPSIWAILHLLTTQLRSFASATERRRKPFGFKPSRPPNRGIIFAGKTYFLWYLLIRPLRDKQTISATSPIPLLALSPLCFLLEGPYATQSNRVIRNYQDRGPALIERFSRVEFCDEDHQAYCWDRDADGSRSLREHAVWLVPPFQDPVEGDVNAESSMRDLGAFSSLLRTPSKYAARIAQTFTSTDPGVEIQPDQWRNRLASACDSV
ncbi:hypothetical protein F5148DRAFT_1370451 [Russula earlei]|uniref:Uncharacterized protein n=1 Tax=Russula earlei TaxID=71964 RepID=A0ACC0TYQ5_9AGAM|nr:hypothetical protein F5148DRAFT_1370451 [Russula earlei]